MQPCSNPLYQGEPAFPNLLAILFLETKLKLCVSNFWSLLLHSVFNMNCEATKVSHGKNKKNFLLFKITSCICECIRRVGFAL